MMAAACHLTIHPETIMTHHSAAPAMSQKIFSSNLAVETVSLYLLCCAVADAGASITPGVLMDKWNGSEASLIREIQRLEEKHILRRTRADASQDPTYQIVHEKDWRL